MLALAANAQLALKQTDDARASLAALLALEPSAVEVRRRLVGAHLAGREMPRRRAIWFAKECAPRRAPMRLYLDYALIDLKSGGLAKALTTAEQLRRGDLGFPELSALKGDVYMADQKPADAARAYAEAAAVLARRSC